MQLDSIPILFYNKLILILYSKHVFKCGNWIKSGRAQYDYSFGASLSASCVADMRAD